MFASRWILHIIRLQFQPNPVFKFLTESFSENWEFHSSAGIWDSFVSGCCYIMTYDSSMTCRCLARKRKTFSRHRHFSRLFSLLRCTREMDFVVFHLMERREESKHRKDDAAWDFISLSTFPVNCACFHLRTDEHPWWRSRENFIQFYVESENANLSWIERQFLVFSQKAFSVERERGSW